MDDALYYHQISVASKDCTKDQKLKLPVLLDHLQEAAWFNATALGFSTLDLLKTDMTWVMNRMLLHVHRMPQLGENLKIETWPAGMDKYFTKRDFRVWTTTNELLVDATSNWLVMDIHERKLIAIPDFIRSAGFIVDRNNLPAISGKLRYDEVLTTVSHPIQVSWFDIDINDHVNHTKYFQWILDGLDGSFLSNSSIKGLDLMFKQEGKYGDQFESRAYYDSESNCWMHTLNHKVSGQSHVLGKTWFEPNC